MAKAEDCFSSDNNRLFVSSGAESRLTHHLYVPELKIYQPSGQVRELELSRDERLLQVLHADDTIRVWDLQQGVQRPILLPSGARYRAIVPVAVQYWALAGREDGTLAVFDAMTGRLVKNVAGVASPIVALKTDSAEQFVWAAHENGQIVSWRLPDFTAVSTLQTGYPLTHIALDESTGALIVAGQNGELEIWDTRTGQRVARLPQQEEDTRALWAARERGEIWRLDDDGQIIALDVSNRQLRAAVRNVESPIATVDTTLQNLAYAEEGTVYVTRGAGQKPYQIDTDRGGISHLRFLQDGRYVIAADQIGVLHLLAVDRKQHVLQMISTREGWSVVDRDGRFDGSEAAIDNVAWQAADQELSIDLFSERYYEPGLLATQLSDQQFINRQPGIITQGISLPPAVSLTLPEDTPRQAGQAFTLTAEIRDQGGGIGDIKFYHNGKITPPEIRRVISERDEDSLKIQRVAFTVTPRAGDNQFKLVVANNMAIESRPQSVVAHFAGEAAPATMHVVTIGINTYQDPALNLDYSVADAQAIAAILNNRQRTTFGHVTTQALFNAQATKAAILAQLRNLAELPQDDALTLYLAGHGIAIQGEWYFLPQETMLRDDEAYYTQVGIPARDIQNALAQTKAQQIIVLLDACYSGAGVQVFRKMQDTQRHFGRGLSKSVGVVMLAATRQDQQAAELTDLGHGLFTYVVTQGLQGLADSQPKDNLISAHELVGYSTREIPAFSRRYLKAAQEPTGFTLGSDFTLLKP